MRSTRRTGPANMDKAPQPMRQHHDSGLKSNKCELFCFKLGKGMVCGPMTEKEEKVHSGMSADDAAASREEVVETPNRRELIEKYGKYAIVAAPLLLFASKARAIHSKP